MRINNPASTSTYAYTHALYAHTHRERKWLVFDKCERVVVELIYDVRFIIFGFFILIIFRDKNF